MMSISIILPTLNEELCVQEAILSCRAPGVEVIVADGGSTDRTVELAEAAGACVVSSGRGRGLQMNAGAAAAKGEALLFLHADTLLPPAFPGLIAEALRDPEVVGGAFALKIPDPSWLMRAMGWMSTRRACWFVPYGDQAIYVRRELFERLGGYAELPLLEDVEFASRLKRVGKLRILPEPVLTSARRWRAEGPWKVTFRNWVIALAYAGGLSPQRLARYYGPPIR